MRLLSRKQTVQVADIHKRRTRDRDLRLSRCRVVRFSRINKTRQRKCATCRREDRSSAWNWRVLIAEERAVDFLSISPRRHSNDAAYVDSMSPRRRWCVIFTSLSIVLRAWTRARSLVRSDVEHVQRSRTRVRAPVPRQPVTLLADNDDGINRKLRESRKMQCELAKCSFADIA